MSVSAISPNWLTVSLDDVILRIVGGGTPSKSKPEYYEGEIPWMSVKDMNKHVLHDTADHISQAAVDNSSTNVILAGTPIIATRMSLGKIVIADFDSAINQDLKALFLPAEIHRDYLVYWYRSVARKIEQMGTGTTVKGIRLEALKGLDFALPPLAEQTVIADKLDTLLAQVENTKARLERIPQILKRFRQSVLAAATSGRLTEMPPAFATEKLRVGQIAVDIRYGTSKKCSKSTGSSPVLRIPNIGDGYINQNNLKFSDFDEKERAKLALQQGDLLVIRSNGSLDLVGKTALAQDKDIGLLFAGYLIRVRLDNQIADPAYVSLCLRSPETRAIIEEKAKSTSGVNNINSKELASLELSLPSPEVQQEIVRRVDQLFAHADRIEQQVNNALTRVNNLTHSILAKAFRGELTEQWRKDNPELTSGENSAEALLERIKAERAAVIAEPKRRKPKA